MHWDEYLAKTNGGSARPLLVEALGYLQNKERALDVGAGALNDTRRLIVEGFAWIDVIDANPSVSRLAATLFPCDGVTVHSVDFSDAAYPQEAYDLASAQYALPFAGPDGISKVVSNICRSLKNGAVFTGNFFGVEDEWFGDPKLAFVTAEQVRQMFSLEDWVVHAFREVRTRRRTAAGDMKDWHLLEVIASRRPGSS